jgi:hypothetical protein
VAFASCGASAGSLRGSRPDGPDTADAAGVALHLGRQRPPRLRRWRFPKPGLALGPSYHPFIDGVFHEPSSELGVSRIPICGTPPYGWIWGLVNGVFFDKLLNVVHTCMEISKSELILEHTFGDIQK